MGEAVQKIGRFAIALLLVRTLVLLTSGCSRTWSQTGQRQADAETSPESTLANLDLIQGQRLKLFILAGQSNMSGLGALPSQQPNAPQVYVFGNDYRWHQGVEPVDSPHNQVDLVSVDPDAGFGPSIAFAQTLIEDHYPDWQIGLIPCAKGSSSIQEWQPSYRDDTLYGSCLKRAQAASTMGEVVGVLFFQGEADARASQPNEELTPKPQQWGDHFSRMVQGWRRDLNQPQLPMVFAQIGSHQRPDWYTHWSEIQQQQAAVNLDQVAMITTQDLPLGDPVHFSTPSYRVIGQRFAHAWRSLQASPSGQSPHKK